MEFDLLALDFQILQSLFSFLILYHFAIAIANLFDKSLGLDIGGFSYFKSFQTWISLFHEFASIFEFSSMFWLIFFIWDLTTYFLMSICKYFLTWQFQFCFHIFHPSKYSQIFFLRSLKISFAFFYESRLWMRFRKLLSPFLYILIKRKH